MTIDKEKCNSVGVALIVIPITTFLAMMVINMPGAFTHCWFESCQTDLLLRWLGGTSVIGGILFLILAGRMKNDE